MTHIAHRVCPLCEACCGLEIRHDAGRVISVRGHDADVLSRGYICPKGAALKDLHEDPDRLRKPLIKRNGVHVEASWDEAFAEIAARLLPLREQHGADSIAVAIGNPTVHKFGLAYTFPHLLKALGSANYFSASTLDQMPRQLACGLMYGHWLSVPVPDITRTDFLLIFGANPLVSNGSMWTVPDFRGKAKALRARGGKLVVIDPRRSETAAVADAHHFIRPGTDVFLLLAMVNTLFAENLVRLGTVAEHVTGIEALKAAVVDFTPERVAAQCGISASEIRTLTRSFAQAERACAYGRMGVSVQTFGTLANWLIDVLNVLTGRLDAEGGLMFPKAAAYSANTVGTPGSGRGIGIGRRASRVSKHPEVFGEFPITAMAEEMETPGAGQVRALISIAANPVLSAPNGARLASALSTLDFMVSIDIYLNETTRHADVILPGLSPLEELHYDVAFTQLSWRNQVRVSAPVFAPDPAHMPEWQVMLKLAAMLRGEPWQDAQALDDALAVQEAKRIAGKQADQAAAVLQAVAPHTGPARMLDLALRSGAYGDGFGMRTGITLAQALATPEGIDLGPHQPRIPEVLRTVSGKVELAPALCVNDLPRVRAVLDAARKDDEFVIIGRRDVRSNNSWMHNLPILAKGPMRCTLLIHPQDAQALGLKDGAMARVVSVVRNAAAISAQVELSEAMMRGVVSLPHGWGHDQAGTRLHLAAERPGANLNAVLDENSRDPLSGNAVLAGVAVRVEAVGLGTTAPASAALAA
jgi:anaerobic selenocysteine-containing dehydrogenase